MSTTISPEEQHEKVRTVVFATAQAAAEALAREVRVIIEEKNAAGKAAVLGLAVDAAGNNVILFNDQWSYEFFASRHPKVQMVALPPGSQFPTDTAGS